MYKTKAKTRLRKIETLRPVRVKAKKIDKTDGLIRRKPRDPMKVKIFCELAKAAVRDGVIFEGKKIVEILPWED